MKFIFYTFCYILYPISFLFVRNKKKYAFGSFAGAFNDNAKYLFIHTCEHCPDIDAAWISDSRATVKLVREHGFKAYHVVSPRGIWHALTSKYWFFNSYTSDIFYSFSGGAVCVNLWHGIGLKRIEYNILTGPLGDRYQKRNFKEVYYHPQSFRAPDYIVTSTPFQTHMFSTAFRVPPSRCLEFGYPRNDVLTYTDERRLDFVKRYEPKTTMELIERMKQYSRVLIYMPTWRDSQRHLFTQSMDLNRLNEVLKSKNELLVLKPHSYVVVDRDNQTFSHILFLPGTLDVYPLLPYTQVLITDYSSVLYDYILMKGKEVILYLYDYREYLNERDLFYPFDENVVGKRVFDFDDLLRVIDQHDYRMDEDERSRLIEKFWGETVRYDSSQRLLDYVRGL